MSSYVTLLGAEDVQRASSTMLGASDNMQRAASQMDTAFHQHQYFLDDWLARFNHAIDRLEKLHGSQAEVGE